MPTSSASHSSVEGVVSADWGLLNVAGISFTSPFDTAEMGFLDRDLLSIRSGISAGPVRVELRSVASSDALTEPSAAARFEISVESDGSALTLSDPSSITEAVVHLPLAPGSYRAAIDLDGRREFYDLAVDEPKTLVRITLWPAEARALTIVRDDGLGAGSTIRTGDRVTQQQYDVPVVFTPKGPVRRPIRGLPGRVQLPKDGADS